MHVRSLCALLLIAAPVAAQPALLVVDAAGGPGSSFRTIQDAVVAAPPGARILVRAGDYAGVRIDGKPLTIVGEPGVVLSNFSFAAIQVVNIPAGADCTVSGLAVNRPAPYATVAVWVDDCQGRVLLDSLEAGAPFSMFVQRSSHVAMSHVGFGAGAFSLTCFESAVNCSDSRFVGTGGGPGIGGAGADLTRSVVSFAGCDIFGQDWFAFFAVGPALDLDASFVTITDDGSHLVSAGAFPGPMNAVVGDGSLVLDRRVRLQSRGGASLVTPGISLGYEDYPLLSVARPQAGSSTTVSMAGAAGGIYAIALGLPADWQLVPGLYGARWLDPATSIVAMIGTLDANGQGGVTLPVPAGTALVGVPLMWQGVADGGPGTSPAYSNPVAFVVRP